MRAPRGTLGGRAKKGELQGILGLCPRPRISRGLPRGILQRVMESIGSGCLDCQIECMSRIEIKQATREDAADIQDVLIAAYARWQERLDDLPDVTGGVSEDIEVGKTWVATETGRVVGCLMGGMHDGHWHLANVAVHPEASGRGVGRRLIAHAEGLARASGASEMMLATHKDLPENITLYEHLGWVISGQEDARVMMTFTL